MDIQAFLKSLEDTGFSSAIRDSNYFFPFLEAVHVMALAVVFGSITVVDLRILGLASPGRSFKAMSEKLLTFTWVAFLVAAATGSLMFCTNARVYAGNTAFRIKLLLLLGAGINMLVFHLTAGRHTDRWDKAPSGPTVGRLTAALSISLWIAVIVAGRVIGFTTTGQQAKEAPRAAIDLDDILGGASGAASPPKRD